MEQPQRDGMISVEGTCPACRNRCSVNYTLEDGKLVKRKYQCAFCAKTKPKWGQPFKRQSDIGIEQLRVAQAVEFTRAMNEVKSEQKGGEKRMQYKQLSEGWVPAMDISRAKARSKITVYEQIKALGIKTSMFRGTVHMKSRTGRRFSASKMLMCVPVADVERLEKKLDELKRYRRHRRTAHKELPVSMENVHVPARVRSGPSNLVMTNAVRAMLSAAKSSGVTGKVTIDIDNGDVSYFVSEVKLTEKKFKVFGNR